MGLKTAEEYLHALQDGRRVIYRGRTVENVVDHPVLGRAVKHGLIDYLMAHDPAYQDVAVVQDGEELSSRFYVPPRNARDLRLRRDLIAEGTRLGGTVVPLIHEIGTDALFGLLHVTALMDAADGTHYYPRVQRFLDDARHADWALAVAQTDVKGDRMKRPYEQSDPDAYLRIVEKTETGVVVSGAKVHTSVSINAERLLVLPTRAMTEKDASYALAFAIPLNTPGLTLMASPFLGDVPNPMERPVSYDHKMVETLTLFDHVWVPWETVFMAGEWRWAGPLARAFVEFHRFTAVAYKLPLLKALVGVAALLARLNGVSEARHVREAIAQLIIYEQTVAGLLDAGAEAGQTIVPGIFRPDPKLVNVAKYHFATGLHTAIQQVQDVAGGLLVTAPSSEDLADEEFGPILDRVLVGAVGTGRDRLKAMYLAQDLVASDLAAYHQVLAVHAEGSIEAEKMTIVQHYALDAAEQEAARLAGIPWEK